MPALGFDALTAELLAAAGAGAGAGAATRALRAAGSVRRGLGAGAGVGLSAGEGIDLGVAMRLGAAGVRTVAGVWAGAARFGSRGGEEPAPGVRAGRAASSDAFWKPPHNCGCRGAAVATAASGSSTRGVQPPSTRCDASRAWSLPSVACSGNREAR